MDGVRNIRKQAYKDAEKYAEAQMNYGKGAGNQRKIIKAQVEERMKNDIYAEAFNQHLAQINSEEVVRKVKTKKNVEKAYSGAKKVYRSARKAENFYYRNKGIINHILGAIFD